MYVLDSLKPLDFDADFHNMSQKILLEYLGNTFSRNSFLLTKTFDES